MRVPDRQGEHPDPPPEKAVGSSSPAAGEWLEVTYNGQTYYVASTKLSCK